MIFLIFCIGFLFGGFFGGALAVVSCYAALLLLVVVVQGFTALGAVLTYLEPVFIRIERLANKRITWR